MLLLASGRAGLAVSALMGYCAVRRFSVLLSGIGATNSLGVGDNLAAPLPCGSTYRRRGAAIAGVAGAELSGQPELPCRHPCRRYGYPNEP